MIKQAITFVKEHISIVSLLTGNIIIIAWTLLRFFTKPINFDLTGQQVLLNQWLHGYMSGSVMAPTNYMLKMLIYAPFQYMPWSPHISIIIMTILINVVSYSLIFFVLKRLMVQLGIKISAYFYLGMVWFAGVAGSIFWIQFANSRNLEVAGGLLLISLIIQLINKPSARLAIGLAFLSGILFFADPLQLYMTAIFAIMCGLYVAISRKLWRQFGLMLVTLGVGYAISILVLYIVQSTAKVEFFSVNSVGQSLAVFRDPIHMIYQTIKANVQLISGANDIGRIRQIVNVVFVGLTGVAFMGLSLKKRISASASFFVFGAIIMMNGVYIASGQPGFGGDTSRYLIMLAPVVVLVIASMKYLNKKFVRPYTLLILLVIAMNSVLVFGAMFNNWTTQLPADTHLLRTINYINQHKYKFAYASMDTAIPATFLFRPDATILPLSCDVTGLHKTYLFYDKALFQLVDQSEVKEVPIILDGDSIGNYPNICDLKKIVNQLGEPGRQEKTEDSLVLIYPLKIIHLRLQ